MTREPLDVVPLWAYFLSACILGWLALDAGYRLGRWRHLRVAEEKDSPVGAMVASILGLLAFLLAFTFGLAANRFETRRETVLEEANTIGTTYLRTRLLPEPQRTATAKLLREYVDVRVDGIAAGKVNETIARSEVLHSALWAEAVQAAQNKDASAPITALFINSLNDLIDVHAKRVQAGLRSRIPVSIWLGLFALTALGLASVGYHAGLSATRRSPAMLGMIVAFACVFFMIADLDRGHEGFLIVSQQPMIDLQTSMRAAN